MKFFTTLIITSIVFIISSFFWQFINIPAYNPNEVVGLLSQKKINPLSDTIRFIFLFLNTVGIFFIIRFFQENKSVTVKTLFDTTEYSKLNSLEITSIKLIIFFLSIYLLVDFFSYNPNYLFYDPLHDGDNLTPAQNFEFTKKIWSSSYAIHGASNSIYGYLGWKIFDIKSIGALRFFYIILLFLIKALTIVLAFQITKLTNLNKNNKFFFFLILSVILINFVQYQTPINYSIFSLRDLYLILYLIFLIQLFSTKMINKNLVIILTFISNVALVLHYDIGTYLQIMNFLLFLYFYFSKQYKFLVYIIIGYLIFWIIFILVFGLSELKLFIDHYIMIVKNIDIIHGIPYPNPIFDIGKNEHASRATRALILLIISSFLIIELIFFSQKKNFSVNQKIILIFFLIIGILSFKNALGRSDSYHIRMSTEMPIIITLFFLIIFILKKNIFYKLNKKFGNFIIILFSILLIFSKFNYTNFKNFNTNVKTFLTTSDIKYLDQDSLIFYEDAKAILKNEDCIFNFTMDLGLPYLLRKKTCTKYIQTYTVSGSVNEKKYILDLKNIKHKYLIYESPKFVVDNIKIEDRLKIVNDFVKKNYNPFYSKNGFKILKKK